jgi:hypothetical protein
LLKLLRPEIKYDGFIETGNDWHKRPVMKVVNIAS